MRIPFAILEGVEVTQPSKSGNSLNAGIDFYVPTKGTMLEFNPGFPEKAFVPLWYKSDRDCSLKTAKETIIDISDPIKIKESDFLTDGIRFQSRLNIKRFGTDPSLEYYLYPGENVRIHSGVAIETDFGQVDFVCNRSGMASNNSIVVGAHVIDTGYSNELMFDVHNIGLTPVVIKPGMKITQLVVMQFVSCTPVQVPYDELYKDMSNIKFRGLNGFGSSDKKGDK